MGNSTQITVEGMAQVGAALKQLPLKLKENIAVGAVRTASQVCVAAVQAEAPVETGLLRDSIRIARRKVPDENTQILYVVFVSKGGVYAKLTDEKGNTMQRSILAGTAVGKADVYTRTRAAKRGGPYYWYFVEFGTSKMSANPFMERGFAGSVGNCLTRARDYAAAQVRNGVLKSGLV